MSTSSLNFEVVDAVDDATWQERLVSHRASALHHPAVHRADHEDRKLLRVVLRDEDEVVGCTLLIEEKRRRFGLPFGGSSNLIAPSAPALSEGVDRRAAREALVDFARSRGAEQLQVQPATSEWLVDDESLAPHRHGAILEFRMRLQDDIESTRSSFHKVHRKNARRAANKGVVVVEDSSREGLMKLRSMQVASAERASERNNAFGVRDVSYFERVQREVYATGLGHCLFAELEGEAIAALAWLQLGGRALTVRSGSTPAGYANYAMYALYDGLVERLIAEGLRDLNAGGVPAEATEEGHPQHGLFEFKKGYGGTATLCHSLEVPLPPTKA